MNKLDFLKKEINTWQEEEIITLEQKEIIMKRYEKNDTSNKLFMIMAILGVLFIGTGIISLLAYNWKNLNVVVRVILSFIPLLITQGLLFYTIKNNKSKVWQESICLANNFGLIISFSLIAQTFQLNNDVSYLFYISTLLSIPITYLTKSKYNLLFNSIVSLFCSEIGMYFVFVLLLPFYINDIRKNKDKNKLFKFIYIINFIIIAGKIDILYDYKILFYISIALLIGYFIDIKLYKKLSLLGIVSSLIIISNLSYDSFLDMNVNINIIHLVIPIFLIIISVYYYKTYKQKEIIIYNIPILLYLLNVLSLSLNIYNYLVLVMIILYNVILIGILLYYINSGLKTNEYGIVKLNVFALNIYILSKVFNSDLSLTIKGLSFIVIGIVFLLTNFYMLKKNNKKEGIKNE